MELENRDRNTHNKIQKNKSHSAISSLINKALCKQIAFNLLARLKSHMHTVYVARCQLFLLISQTGIPLNSAGKFGFNKNIVKENQ